MDALLMCGGRGTRLGPAEKPLRRVAEVPMVERVRRALAASAVDRLYAVTSPHVPETTARLDLPRIETAGDGYVTDLQAALADERVAQPVLTVAADLPLLEAAVVDEVLRAHEAGPLATVVPVGRVSALGFSVDSTIRSAGTLVQPAGVNVVAPGEETVWLTRDYRLAANVNRPVDLCVATWLAAQNR